MATITRYPWSRRILRSGYRDWSSSSSRKIVFRRCPSVFTCHLRLFVYGHITSSPKSLIIVSYGTIVGLGVGLVLGLALGLGLVPGVGPGLALLVAEFTFLFPFPFWLMFWLLLWLFPHPPPPLRLLFVWKIIKPKSMKLSRAANITLIPPCSDFIFAFSLFWNV